jgi:hypothetical protein
MMTLTQKIANHILDQIEMDLRKPGVTNPDAIRSQVLNTAKAYANQGMTLHVALTKACSLHHATRNSARNAMVK